MIGWTEYYKIMIALTMYREARGETDDGHHDSMRAVGFVIKTRVNLGWGDWDHVITKKWQFSSLTAPGDSQLIIWPDSPDNKFELAMELADLIFTGADIDDPTNGATHYFNPHVVLPTWAAAMKKVASIGNHDFYK